MKLAALIAACLSLGLVADLAMAQTPSADRRVAVTWDDLPFQDEAEVLCDQVALVTMTAELTAMLTPLREGGVAFVNAGQVCAETAADEWPGILAMWQEAGYALGNHTARHVDLNAMTAEAWLADVDAGEPAIRAAAEARGETLRWFRHPYLHAGDTPEKKTAAEAGLATRGYVIAPVTLDNSDWLYATVYRAAENAGDEALMRRIGEAYVERMSAVLDVAEPYSAELNDGREPAQILLVHANSLNRDWYSRIHEVFVQRGYRFVSLEEAMRDPIYARADTYVGPDGIGWLHRWALADGKPMRGEPPVQDWVQRAYDAGPPAKP